MLSPSNVAFKGQYHSERSKNIAGLLKLALNKTDHFRNITKFMDLKIF